MTNINSNWDRIAEVIRMADMTINGFARHIGLPRAENLYQIKRGNNGISRYIAERIVSRYPNINISWLLTGSGYMYSDDIHSCSQIPFYGGDVESSMQTLDNDVCECYMFLPQIADADLAIRYIGRAMTPHTESGDIVILKKNDSLQQIVLGGEYVVVTTAFTALRYVRKSADEGYVRLVAANSADFDDIEVKYSDIDALYAVCGKLSVY